MFKHMNIYLLSSIVQNILPFIALPLITYYITPSQYSNIAMFTLLVSFFSAFIGINAHGAISRKFVDKDEIDISIYIGNVIFVLLGSIIVLIPFLFLYSFKIEEYTLLGYFWIVIAFMVAIFQFISLILLTILQMQNKSIYYGIFNIIKSTTNILLILLMVVYYKYNWEGYLYANLAVAFLFSTISFIFILKNGYLKFKINLDYILHILKFGIPLIPHVLGAIAISMTDRLLLINMEGAESTGLYQLAWQVVLPISLIIEAFKNSYIPWLFEQLKLNNNKKIIRITYIIFIFTFILGGIFISISIVIIDVFFSDIYKNAIILVPYLVIALVFQGLYYTVGLIISFQEKTSILAVLTLLTGVSNLIFSYYLIKTNGMLGAAQGTLIAYFITFIFTWLLAYVVRPMPWFSFWRKNEI